MTMKDQSRFLIPSLMAVACLLMAAVAHAETPLSLVVSEELAYESNVFKDNANKRRDAISTTGVQVGFNKEYGRQTYKASAAAVAKRYKNTKDYNNDGYNVVLGASSSLLSNWYAAVDYSNVRQQQNPEDQGNLRYLETVSLQSGSLFLQYGLYGRWSVNGTLDKDKITYDVLDYNDRDSLAYRLGLRFSPTDLIYIDGSVKRSDIDYDKYRLAGGTGNKVKRTDYDLSSRWVVTGYSQLSGRIGWTQEKNDGDSRRDFNGLTGRVSWNYSPAGKMTYGLTFDRDTNNAGGFTSLQFANLSQYTSQNRVTTGLSLSATWTATSKISMNARTSYRKIREELANAISDGTVTGVTGSSRANGRYNSYLLGFKYQPIKSLALACDVEKYSRSQSILTREFDGESVSCSAVFSID